ncbi:MAG: hypothetical protein LBP32_04945, partial [Spirochaetaceae bacterium]|nr:hypothetical protein [Spirochaetaceae bacterium]
TEPAFLKRTFQIPTQPCPSGPGGPPDFETASGKKSEMFYTCNKNPLFFVIFKEAYLVMPCKDR